MVPNSWSLLLICLHVGGHLALPPSPTSTSSLLTQSKEATVNVVTRKWMHLLHDKFLSYTLEPHIALEFQEYRPSTLNMFRALSPAMVRFGGPETDHVNFLTSGNNGYTVSEEQWKKLNEFKERAKLDLIVCLNPMERLHSVWQSKSALEFIDASDKLGYNLQWQLGYELQRLMNLSDPITGRELGRDIVRLRKILDSFPRYSKSVIIGPDVIDYSTPKNIEFVKDLLNESGESLAVLTWHPKFAKVEREKEDVGALFSQILHQADGLSQQKDPTKLKPLAKKEVWIAESDAEGYTGDFNDALTWMKRLGTAAMLGVPVYMKQITRNSITQPTPDFWVSMLYKSLVGRAVLEAKLQSGDKNLYHVFAHCTEMSPNNIVDSDYEYERGAITMFGLNLAAEETKLNIKASVKDEPVHMYILTAENRNNNEETYLNGQPLRLSPTGQLPVISPKVKNATRNLQVDIPPRSVYFIVLPDIKVKQCTMYPTPESNGMPDDQQSIEFMHDHQGVETTDDEIKEVYVRYGPKKKKNVSDSIGKDKINENLTEKLLKLKFPIPESEIGDNIELERSAKSIRDQNLNSNTKNMISKMSIKESRMANRLRSQIKENSRSFIKTSDDDDDEDDEIMKRMNKEKALSDAMLNTKFVMFSDDDWLSNFSHAKKAVEAAKKIIEAFDEAEIMKRKECDKEPSVLKVENDKYHVRYGKDALRKKKFAVLSVLDNDNNVTNGSNIDSKQATTEAIKVTVTENPTVPTTGSTYNPVPIQESKLSTARRRRQTNKFYQTEKQQVIKPAMNTKRVIKPSTDFAKSNKNTIAKPRKNKIRNKSISKRARRSTQNNLGNSLVDTKMTQDYTKNEPFSKECEETIMKNNDDVLFGNKMKFEDDKVVQESEEGGDKTYHPGEFYEHRNLQKVQVNKKGRNFEDMYEAESSGHNRQEYSRDEAPTDMGIVKAVCSGSNQDSLIKDKLVKELNMYYENTEKLAKEQMDVDNPDSNDNAHLNSKPPVLLTDEQRVKRGSNQNKGNSNVGSTQNNNEKLLDYQSSAAKPETNTTEKDLSDTINPLDDSGKRKDFGLDKNNPILNISTKASTSSLLAEEAMNNKQTVHPNDQNIDKQEKPVVLTKEKEIGEPNEPKRLRQINGDIKQLIDESVKKPDITPQVGKLNSTDLRLETVETPISVNRQARENKNYIQKENDGQFKSTNIGFNMDKLHDTTLKPQTNVITLESPKTEKNDKHNSLVFESNEMSSANDEDTLNHRNAPSLEETHTDKKFESNSTKVIDPEHETHDLDIVCGRTKNYGTFCVGSEHKLFMDENNDKTDFMNKNINNMLLTENDNKNELSLVRRREISKHDQQIGNHDWYRYLQEGPPPRKASRSAPYIEDFEELLSQMKELQNDPESGRHRRLVHFTVPGVDVDEINDKKILAKHFEGLSTESKSSVDNIDLKDKSDNILFRPQFRPYENDENYSMQKSTEEEYPTRSEHEKLMHELVNEYSGFDETKREPIKRTVLSAPKIESKMKQQRHETNFGSDTHFNTHVRSDQLVPARIPKRHSVLSSKHHSNDFEREKYSKPHLQNHHRIENDESIEYQDREDSDVYFQRSHQPMMRSRDDMYSERYYKNDGSQREWADQNERGYVRLPGDVYRPIEGTRDAMHVREPHFTKSSPIQMMPVAMSSPDMYRPKMRPFRAKRSLGPYFRNVQDDIVAMKNELAHLPQYISQTEKFVQPRSPKNSIEYHLQSKSILQPYSSPEFMAKSINRKRRSRQYNTMTENEILQGDEKHLLNEVVKKHNIHLTDDLDDFDKTLIHEKDKQFRSLTKTFSELAKIYEGKKANTDDGLMVVVDGKNDAVKITNRQLGLSVMPEKRLLDTSKVTITGNEDGKKISLTSETSTSSSLQPNIGGTGMTPRGSQSDEPITYVINQMRNVVYYIMKSLTQF